MYLKLLFWLIKERNYINKNWNINKKIRYIREVKPNLRKLTINKLNKLRLKLDYNLKKLIR